MSYLKSEHLKFKRTISNKLLWIAPLFTAVFAWIAGGFAGFQYMSFYWWYAFLLPGTIAILCALSHLKEDKAGKYYAIFSMPIDLVKFEMAKAVLMIEKLVIAALFLAAFVSVSNVISPALAVYNVGLSVIGSIAIVLASIWQIPFCLFLARKAGMAFPIFLNALLGILSPIVLKESVFAWLCPYCWAAKLAEPLLGIEISGVYAGNAHFSISVIAILAASLFLFMVLSFLDAKNFQKGGN